MSTTDAVRTTPALSESQPRRHQRGREIQAFDPLRDLPLGLIAETRRELAARVNGVLADTRILRDLDKKTHWNMRGPTFYQLHLLMDKHADEQSALVDAMAEMVDSDSVAVGGEVAAWVTDVVVVDESGGEGE